MLPDQCPDQYIDQHTDQCPDDFTFECLPLAALRWSPPSDPQRTPRPTVNRAFAREYDMTALLELDGCADGRSTLRLPARGGDQRMCRVHLQTLPNRARLGVIEDVQMYHQDPLTGLEDRRALRLDALALERVGLALLDIDGFKGINDALGHAAGDEVLGALAGLLRASAWTWGVRAYRLGGDEFVLMGDALKTGPLWPEGLIPLQSRFRRLMARCGMDVPGFSFGVAAAPRDGRGLCALLEQADARLTTHKVNRRGAAASQLVRQLKQRAAASPADAARPAPQEVSPWIPAPLPRINCAEWHRTAVRSTEVRSAEKA